ncbi:MAG: calcium/sodium antiporter [Lachnospiraceae bacterium]|nr:calcium/sodium antiporter [Lachnospiraceae bacterium]
MIIAVLLFAVGLICLIKGGDWFVDGAAGVAEKFKVPDLLIGATVVSIGTTLPELMVSSNSALSGHGEIAYGNALGSIICNTALIAAITVAVKPGKIDKKTLKVPIIFFFLAASVYCFAAYVLGSFTRGVGIVLFLMFVAYMTILVKQAIQGIKEMEKSKAEGSVKSDEVIDDSKDESKPMWKLIVFLVLGAALIAVGADLLVDNGTIIAKGLGVPESVIALTIVALGTSLPELVTAITSLAKGHGALSLGNICGANLFNMVFVSAVAMILAPFDLPVEKTISIAGAERNAALVIDMPVVIFVMAILAIPALIKGKLSRWQGILLLCTYATYIIFQFVG